MKRLAVTAVLLLAGACSDDGGDDAASTTTLPLPSADAPGDPAVVELEELLAGGRSGPVHAVYESEGDTTELGGDLRLELWRDGEHVRYDTRLEAGSGVGETVVVVGPDGGTACSRTDDAPFACQPTDEQPSDVLFLGSLAGAERDVEAYDDVVGGVDARCFRVDDDLGEAAVCVDSAGVPVLLTAGEARLVRVSLDADVPASVFDTASLAG